MNPNLISGRGGGRGRGGRGGGRGGTVSSLNVTFMIKIKYLDDTQTVWFIGDTL